MKNVKLLVLSDIHLERVSEIKQEFLLSAINEKVEQTKNAGFEPVVVFAGDVNNSTKGYQFISKVNTKCIYVAGNHEFWECDYYETLDALRNEQPSNVHFLHNDVIVCGQYLILGTTLWTDVGQNLNKDILKHAGSRMNDMSYISAKKWYENKDNIRKIEELYDGLENKIETKKWNALIEIEENEKAWKFLKDVDAVLRAIKKAKKIDLRLNDDLYAKSDWWKITKEIFNDTKKKVSLDEKSLTWGKFIKNLTSLYKNYSLLQEEGLEFLENSAERNLIFQKIRHIAEVEKKDIVMLSHHLPFYEEILVGSFMQEYNKMPINLYNEIDTNIFMVRSGTDYPGFNYMLRALKGDLERKNDITHIVNYYNDGANKLPDFLSKNIKCWIHGHEHHFRHCDYVKGIQVVTNPCGSSLSLFDIKESEMKLNSHYMTYHNIKKEDINAEIDKIKRGFVSTTKDFLDEKELEDSVKIWALKHFNLEQYKGYLRKVSKASEKILALSVEYVQAEEQDEQKRAELLNEIEEKISIWKDSYNYNCSRIKKLHDDLLLSFNVRTNRNFSFQNYCTKSLIMNQDLYTWIMGNATAPQEIKEGVVGIFSGKLSFEAKENIKIALKYVEKLEKFLDKVNIEHVHQVKKEQKENFEQLSAKSLGAWRVSEKIEEKWRAFSSKTFYSGRKNVGLNLDNDF